MRTDVTTYYNGRRYMRRVRRVDSWAPTSLRTFITFAYRGVPAEWPAITSYTIR